jgi:hypothetical protein
LFFEAILTALLVLFTFLLLGKLVNKLREFTRLHPSKAVLEDEDILRVVKSGETSEH